MKEVDEGIKACTAGLLENENDVDLLCNRADLYLLNEQYDEGSVWSLILLN